MKIILASGSPRRRELLGKIIREYEIIKSDFDESNLKKEIKNPEDLVKELSLKKAEDVLEKIDCKEEYSNCVIIAADTIVYFNGEVLGKPKDEKNAFDILKKLQGNDNYVYTGMTIIIKENENKKIQTVFTKSTVTFKEMTDDEILEYIATGDPMDKAGAYAIQGVGSKNIAGYEGSYDSVVGLDTEKLKIILKNNNII